MAKINITENDEGEESLNIDSSTDSDAYNDNKTPNINNDPVVDSIEFKGESVDDSEQDDILNELYEENEVDSEAEEALLKQNEETVDLEDKTGIESNRRDDELENLSLDSDSSMSNEIAKAEEDVISEGNSRTVGDALDESKMKFNESASDDSDLGEAVDDIVRSESDEALELQDKELDSQVDEKQATKKQNKIKKALKAWWNNSTLRYATMLVLFIGVIAGVLIPVSRYAILNLFGVRVSSSMTIIDSQTRLPLKNISVTLQDKTVLSDPDGGVELTGLKLGASSLSVQKLGYAENKKQIVLGWGSNPIGEQDITATGVQYTFVLSDWVSGAPVTSAEASAGENSAKVDDKGKIVLTVGQTDLSNLEVIINASGYRDFIINTRDLNKEELKVIMVSDRKDVFVSNRDGKFDIYGIYLDGKEESRLVEASGSERVVPTILQNPTTSLTAFVSSREGFKNGDGYLLDGLYILDSKSGQYEKIARSEQIQVVGWSGDRLVYWQIVEGTSAGNSQRSKLFSYEAITKEKTELATANFFNDVELVNNVVYYAVSAFAVPLSQAKLYSIDVDGKNKITVIDSQVFTIFRTQDGDLLFNGDNQKWFKMKLTKQPEEVENVTFPSNYIFVNSPDGSKTAWVDIRDGKGVVLTSSADSYTGKQLLSDAGISSVQYWAGEDALVYRVIKTGETADYFVKLDGSDPIKITDVTISSNRYY